MRRRVACAFLIALGMGLAWAAGQDLKKPVVVQRPLLALQPGVVSLVEVPALEQPPDSPAMGGHAAPKFPGKAVAGKAPAVAPLSGRQSLEALRTAPGGEAVLAQIATDKGVSVADLIARAPGASPPRPSPMVPTDWDAGVVLSPHAMRTSENESGYAYIDLYDAVLSGWRTPSLWPSNDVIVFYPGCLDPDYHTTSSGRDIAACWRVIANLHITDRPPGTRDAYLIEFALRDAEHPEWSWQPHVISGGLYVPLARVGDTPRYIGVVSAPPGYCDISLYFEGGPLWNMGVREPRLTAFYYVKIQRVAG